MGVGTSLGKTFDDLFHFHQNQYDPERFPAHDESNIEKSVNKAASGANSESDVDMVRNPLEILPGVNPPMAVLPEVMMQQKAFGSDSSNIYNDSGDIVDFDLKTNKPLPLMKPMGLIQPESTFNEIDALADK